ncbi:DUF4304 domain-containing protein [Paenibacillus sp. FSL R7-0331]|uniref:DUF4304 domain-containing protein n=1 Tax=Paenibacillus sp. FSL R7-0331 TaxID=1536773 RepID=UPI0004F60E7D|nr:DUF4304 domain-containing protein [Paenibacillus sp. FSL R7-0331]AIQ50675.1 hypothetical protein R70331_03395 [Paenibacillus sp. FSL R7-0331]
MKELFKEIITNDIKPFFKQHGYRKKDLNFHKTEAGFIYKINFQKYPYNTSSKLMFYINCSVHSAELIPFQSKQPEDLALPPLDFKAHLNARIRELCPAAPQHYTLTPETDRETFTAELIRHLEEALSFMHAMTSARDIADYYMDRTALYMSEEIFRLLLHSGDQETATDYLARLKEKYGAEKRWAIFERKYDAIWAEYGLDK